ncbi:MAG: proline--tRNA ligase [Rickettsiales bacterium]|nr:proline--tRNA ligase [Rickettsiales bacterium]
MRLSKYYLPTTKDVSKDVVLTSHKLMLKAGMIKQCSSGLYTLLPLGYKVMRKIENIIQEELDRIGAMRISMPIITDEKLWQESGRADSYGDEMLRIKDRAGHNLVYSPTNEEAVVDVFRGQVSSYKQLPLSLYQINWKFRDEIRPRFGLMRAREFLMMDNYSFAIDMQQAEEIYNQNCEAYLRMFKRMGLKVIPMQADNGAIGGTFSCEFQILAESGESAVFYDEDSYKQFCDMYSNPDFSWKDMQKIANGKVWAFTEEKYNEDECKKMGYKIKQTRGIEVGHVFIFGDKYTKSMNVVVKGADGKDFYPQMGSYGIGVTRVIAACIEANNDNKGIIWPKALSPFDCILINLDPKNEEITKACDAKYNELIAQSVDVLYDDTDKSIGEKFAVADLLGIPTQIILGKKSFPNFEEKSRI